MRKIIDSILPFLLTQESAKERSTEVVQIASASDNISGYIPRSISAYGQRKRRKRLRQVPQLLNSKKYRKHKK